MADKTNEFESGWMGRSLKNYQRMHGETARKRKVYVQFMAATTLTKAKKILWGLKGKQDKV